MSSEQNRREPRLRVQVPVILSFGKKTAKTATEDISYRGLYVPLEDELPPLRQLVKVEIQLPSGSETFTPHAMVVRHGDDYGKRGVGLEFFGRTESVAWDQFVRDAQQHPQPPTPSVPPQPGLAAGQQPFAQPPLAQQPFAHQSAPPPFPQPGFAQHPPAQPFAQQPFTQPFPQAAPQPAPWAPYGQQAPPAQQPLHGHFAAGAPPHTPLAPPAPVIHGLTPPPPPPDAMPVGGHFAPPPATAWDGEQKSAPPPPLASAAPAFTGANRRRHARFPMPIEIRVRTSHSMHVAYGIDASLGGLSLCGNDLALNVGEHLVLNLAQPGTPLSFRVEATVRRTVPAPHAGTFGYGVEFVSLEPTRQTMLQEFYDASSRALVPAQ